MPYICMVDERENGKQTMALTTFSDFGIEPASAKAQAEAARCVERGADDVKLSSNIRDLDGFFDGGLPYGSVVEWGVPFGLGGREVVLAFLSRTPRTVWTLWISSKPQFTVYPPAWHARGVDLERIRFTCSSKPVEELKPALLDPFFKVIVFDAPRHFTDDDCAFIARGARARGQLVLILRDFLLGQRRGNVWARYRVNCWRPSQERMSQGRTRERHLLQNRRSLYLRSVRGLASRQIVYDPPDPLTSFLL